MGYGRKMKKLSIPRGFRDLPPNNMIPRLQVIGIIREVFELYGFSPMETPSIEYWETLSGKYGGEAENKLIWRFEDPFSGKMYALRYDLTVPLARYVSMHTELPMPFKRYQIGPVWRHEEPQKGRYREFIQADIDIVGSPFIEADAEIINAISEALERIGLDDYVIKINHRELLREIFEKELDLVNPFPVYRAIDKLDKIGIDGVIKELEKIGLSQRKIEKIKEIIKISSELELKEDVQDRFPRTEKTRELLEELAYLNGLLKHPEKARLDISLVRGLDYYTGIIFEFVLEKGSPGSVAGGGRYDELIGYFREDGSIPATGGSIGFERIMDVLLERKMIREQKSVTKLLIVNMTPSTYKHAWKLAEKFRENGIPTEVDLMKRNQHKQRKRSQALDIEYIVFIGEKELESGKYTLYDRKTNERFTGSLEEIIKRIETRK